MWKRNWDIEHQKESKTTPISCHGGRQDRQRWGETSQQILEVRDRRCDLFSLRGLVYLVPFERGPNYCKINYPRIDRDAKGPPGPYMVRILPKIWFRGGHCCFSLGKELYEITFFLRPKNALEAIRCASSRWFQRRFQNCRSPTFFSEIIYDRLILLVQSSCSFCCQ